MKPEPSSDAVSRGARTGQLILAIVSGLFILSALMAALLYMTGAVALRDPGPGDAGAYPDGGGDGGDGAAGGIRAG